MCNCVETALCRCTYEWSRHREAKYRYIALESDDVPLSTACLLVNRLEEGIDCVMLTR